MYAHSLTANKALTKHYTNALLPLQRPNFLQIFMCNSKCSKKYIYALLPLNRRYVKRQALSSNICFFYMLFEMTYLHTALSLSEEQGQDHANCD